jgi:hypothetical protein
MKSGDEANEVFDFMPGAEQDNKLYWKFFNLPWVIIVGPWGWIFAHTYPDNTLNSSMVSRFFLIQYAKMGIM